MSSIAIIVIISFDYLLTISCNIFKMLITTFIFSIIISFLFPLISCNIRCGNDKHSQLTRPCALNDTLCGYWDGRYWKPFGCHYQDISPQDARKCLGKRTLAFIGDSQIRDIGFAVAMFLSGQSLEDASDMKFDKYDINSNHTMKKYFLKIENISHWKLVLPRQSHYGLTFPTKENAIKNNYEWQVQYWEFYKKEYLGEEIIEVLNNQISSIKAEVNEINLAFMSYGLHNQKLWDDQPYDINYFENIYSTYRNLLPQVSVPTIWVPMNEECLEDITLRNQEERVSIANRYINEMSLKYKLPFWDAASVLRSKSKCNVSADGVHVKVYVDIMRSKMLFNHLCDHNMNWRGNSIENFI